MLEDNLQQVLDCEICDGKGICNAWVSPDGDYDFEWCDCNPYRIIVGEI